MVDESEEEEVLRFLVHLAHTKNLLGNQRTDLAEF